MIKDEKWFPDLPERWEVSRLGNCFEQVRESVKEELGIVTVFRDGEVTLRTNRRSDGYTEATDYSLYQVIRPGQLGIHNMDAFAGAVGVSDSHGMCSPVVTVCEAKPNANAKYFSWVLREMARSGWIEANAKSVRERTSEFRWPMAKQQLVPLPPRVDQDAIVDFLDRELNQVDELLKKIDALDKAVLEKSRSLVLKCVTSGVREHQAYKKTTIDWLPQIPESWELKKIKYSIKSMKGGVWGEEVIDEDGSGVWCVRIADFDRVSLIVDPSSPTMRKFKKTELSGRLLEKGDLILEKSGGGEATPVGAVVRFNHDVVAVCSNFSAVLKLGDMQDSRFWAYAHSAIYFSGLTRRSIKQTTDIQNLDTGKYFDEKIGFPGYSEQLEIADFLDYQTNKLTLLRNRLSKVSDKVRQRRTALIAAAVMGNFMPKEPVHG